MATILRIYPEETQWCADVVLSDGSRVQVTSPATPLDGPAPTEADIAALAAPLEAALMPSVSLVTEGGNAV